MSLYLSATTVPRHPPSTPTAPRTWAISIPLFVPCLIPDARPHRRLEWSHSRLPVTDDVLSPRAPSWGSLLVAQPWTARSWGHFERAWLTSQQLFLCPRLFFIASRCAPRFGLRFLACLPSLSKRAHSSGFSYHIHQDGPHVPLGLPGRPGLPAQSRLSVSLGLSSGCTGIGVNLIFLSPGQGI